ncbi:hypothetical protein FXV77_00070 [Sphingobacterium phlebotomi]|uniref:F5/8 type C domain-containing protein n=1 Tax=Sphingobacterium phlebotomi TaxID=2605433 RepID=A0A5D4HAR0_9SPHI|nr:hypothetical protein [Sphingobacterium phlebotomi]TYR37728.1 hypothetical protein FXV77_00070 [Sphingobacterium phlebotomi]
MKKLLLIAFMLLIMVTHHTLAQSKADASWVLTADQSAVVTGDIVAHHQTLHNLSVNNYISGDGGQRILPPSGSWPAETGPNNNRFIEYKISPDASYDLTVNEISMLLSFNSSSYGHAKIAWASDSVNFRDLAADIPLVSGSAPVEHKFDHLDIEIPAGKSLYLRIYPWTTALMSNRYLVSKNVNVKLQTTTHHK